MIPPETDREWIGGGEASDEDMNQQAGARAQMRAVLGKTGNGRKGKSVSSVLGMVHGHSMS